MTTLKIKSDESPTKPLSFPAPFPTEILLQIFAFATDEYASGQNYDMRIQIGRCAPWSRDLCVKKALIRVCKAWRDMVLESLYENIYLHRVGQLCPLIRSLVESSDKLGGTGYAGWIRHIQVHLFVPANWEKVFSKKAAKLLTMSTSCRSVTWVVNWAGQDNEPFSFRSPLINMLVLSKHILRITITSLRAFAFALNGVNHRKYPGDVDPTLLFPNLEELTCEARRPSVVCNLNVVAHEFTMPSLQKLTITFPWSWSQHKIGAKDVEQIFSVLEMHGKELKSLALDTLPLSESIEKDILDVLNLTPKLKHLRCCSTVFSTTFKASGDIATPDVFSTRLTSLELFTFTPHDMEPVYCLLDSWLSMAGDRAKFPQMESIAIIHQWSPHVSLAGAVKGNQGEAFVYFLSWSKRLRERGVALLGYDGEPLISVEDENQNRWSGQDSYDDSDLDDSSYVYESESDSDISSDTDSNASYSTVGSTEALEIFERRIFEDDPSTSFDYKFTFQTLSPDSSNDGDGGTTTSAVFETMSVLADDFEMKTRLQRTSLERDIYCKPY